MSVRGAALRPLCSLACPPVLACAVWPLFETLGIPMLDPHPHALPCLQDYSLPQVEVGLQADPLSLSLTESILAMLAGALLPPPAAEGGAPPPAEGAAAAEGGGTPAAAVLPGQPNGSTAAAFGANAPSPFASSMASSPSSSPGGVPPSPAGVGGATAPVVSLDLQLARLDLRLSADVAGAGGSGTGSMSARSAASAAHVPAVFEACVACSAASLSVQSMLDGMAVQVSVTRSIWPAGVVPVL